MLTTHLPSLAPPPTSLLPSLSAYPGEQASSLPANARRPPPKVPSHAYTSKSSLAVLSLDERTIHQRKINIATYGYSWLRPAGCTKTMQGRREEEIEREETERQLAEAEREERVRAEIEEMERVESLNAQGERERRGEAIGVDGRDLDDDVPDAEENQVNVEEEEEDDDDDDDEEDENEDLDDEIPDAGEPYYYDSRREPDTESEEERSVTEEVGFGRLGEAALRRSPRRRAPLRSSGAISSWTDEPGEDAEALANAMLDEDELGEAERDLDDDVPEAGGERDLDDDVPAAEEEGEWQHTDTELDIEMDDSAMEMSFEGIQTRSQTRRRSSGAVAGNVQRSQAQAQVQFETPGTEQSGRSRMSWLGSVSARRNLFGRGPIGSGLFGSRRSGANNSITPPQEQEQMGSRPRRGGRRGHADVDNGVENVGAGVRQSLD